ncbi:hypothetical protein SNEBB_000086 [Seison nebaliae]|nr:hypothetical protein SNEBB_000086 [Seison nebaliae]
MNVIFSPFDLYWLEMFLANGTQMKKWMFSSSNEVEDIRRKVFTSFTKSESIFKVLEENKDASLMSFEESEGLLRYYTEQIKQACMQINPPLCVVGSAIQLFKRFYMRFSILQYHPNHIYITCLYLACKIEEFFIPLVDYCLNLRKNDLIQKLFPSIEPMKIIITEMELIILEALDFDLICHSPYRALNGHLLIFATSEILGGMTNKEKTEIVEPLKSTAMDSLDKSWASDICFLFPPSTIALCCFMMAMKERKYSFDNYVKNRLIKNEPASNKRALLTELTKIRKIGLKNYQPETMEKIEEIGKN